jgi:hypothetical protein
MDSLRSVPSDVLGTGTGYHSRRGTALLVIAARPSEVDSARDATGAAVGAGGKPLVATQQRARPAATEAVVGTRNDSCCRVTPPAATVDEARSRPAGLG